MLHCSLNIISLDIYMYLLYLLQSWYRLHTNGQYELLKKKILSRWEAPVTILLEFLIVSILHFAFILTFYTSCGFYYFLLIADSTVVASTHEAVSSSPNFAPKESLLFHSILCCIARNTLVLPSGTQALLVSSLSSNHWGMFQPFVFCVNFLMLKSFGKHTVWTD